MYWWRENVFNFKNHKCSVVAYQIGYNKDEQSYEEIVSNF